MAFAGFDLPDIKESDLQDEKQRRQIMEYLYQLTEQLRYVLSNLDEENFSDDFKAEVQQSERINDITQRIDDAQQGLSSMRRQTAEGFAQTVSKDGVISAINQSSEMVQVAADKINLQGYVTVTDLSGNGTTTINGGNITTGVISGDRIMGGTIVGSTVYGGTVSGGTITGASMEGVSVAATQFSIIGVDGYYTAGYPIAPASMSLYIPMNDLGNGHVLEFRGGLLVNYYTT